MRSAVSTSGKVHLARWARRHPIDADVVDHRDVSVSFVSLVAEESCSSKSYHSDKLSNLPVPSSFSTLAEPEPLEALARAVEGR
jgi:hypothetical protein